MSQGPLRKQYRAYIMLWGSSLGLQHCSIREPSFKMYSDAEVAPDFLKRLLLERDVPKNLMPTEKCHMLKVRTLSDFNVDRQIASGMWDIDLSRSDRLRLENLSLKPCFEH